MKAFVSHSFEDRAHFDNVAWAFKNANIQYWDPSDIQSGALLSDQLHKAIADSAFCVFIATSRSVNSPWCGAELGAFWGAGKKVFVYLADSDMAESALPRQFQGHFREQRIPRLVNHVQASLASLELEMRPSEVWSTEWRLGTKTYRERLELRVASDGRIVGQRFYNEVGGPFNRVYPVQGFHSSRGFYWMEYHEEGGDGGGTLLLRDIGNGMMRGLITAAHCKSGLLRCYINEWALGSPEHAYSPKWHVPLVETSVEREEIMQRDVAKAAREVLKILAGR